MIKRLNAFRIVFNFLLSLVELLIGVRFLINFFGSSDSSAELAATVREGFDQMGFLASGVFGNYGLEKPVSALLLMSGFMIFGFIMIIIVPIMTEKKEKELELAEDDFEFD